MDLNMSFESTMSWNLKVLQRIDKQIVRVVGTACFVSIYDFDKDSKSWTKLDVEGTLFLVKRSSAPFYRLIVLNRYAHLLFFFLSFLMFASQVES